MNAMKKKMLTGILAGAVLLGGGLGTMSAQAETPEGHRMPPPPMAGQKMPGQHPKVEMNADEAAKHVAETFGVEQSEVKKAIEDKEDFRDIGQAAMYAKITGKSFKDVLALHKDQKDWREIGKSLGVTHAQIREAMLEMRAMHIGQKGLLAQDKALALLKNGYQSKDIMMAAVLAKESGKDVQAVLDMKKINNRWSDVADQLGVDKSKLRPEGAPHHMGGSFQPGPMGGPQGGPPPEMMEEGDAQE